MSTIYCPYHGPHNGFANGCRMNLHGGSGADGSMFWWYECPCCDNRTPGAPTIDEATALARYRFEPAQEPLKLNELVSLERPYPLWIEYSNGVLLPVILTDHKLQHYDGRPAAHFEPNGTWNLLSSYALYWRCWLRKPTDAERKTAWREKEPEQADENIKTDEPEVPEEPTGR